MYRFSPASGESPLRKTGDKGGVVDGVGSAGLIDVVVAASTIAGTVIGEIPSTNALTMAREITLLERVMTTSKGVQGQRYLVKKTGVLQLAPHKN